VKKSSPFFDNPEALEARLIEMDKRLDRLRALYESFFMGIERMPPNVPRRDLNRMILEVQQVPIHNATMRFRFQSLSQRWVLLTTYWNRTFREIEAGTYRRDIARAQRHMADRGGAITEEEAVKLGIPSNRVKAFVARQDKLLERRGGKRPEPPPEPVAPATTPAELEALRAAPPSVPAVARPRPPGPALADRDFDDFYRRYVDAHQSIGAAAPSVNATAMRAKLDREIPRILADKNCSRVNLEVFVEDGKVRMRARPVRG
jgi:hypothetical protein